MRMMASGAVLVGIALALPVAAQEHPHGDHSTAHGEHQHAEAPTAGLRAELIRDVEQLERKYVALAEAMSGRYDWRPGEGVRSVGELFGHVANGNFLIPSMAGLEREMADTNFEELDEAGIVEGLRHSFAHVKHSIADVPDEQLDDATRMFGQDATKRQVLLLLVTHMHEHLGQAIAYARGNGVTPPWSR